MQHTAAESLNDSYIMTTSSTFKLQKDNVSTRGSFVREFEKEFSRIFQGTTFEAKRVFEVVGPVPKVCKSPKELDKVQKLNLRTSVQTVTSKTVDLKQFDPNFFSHANIWCRYPGCKQRRSRQCKFDGSKTSKEDLYLCPSHRSNLEDYIAKMCAQKGIKFYTSSENINTYTSKIGLLESAYNLLTKQTPLITGSPRAAILLQEVFLNLRNYFLIVNTLLNPDDENVELALPAVMSVLERILQLLGDREYSSAMLLTLVGLIDLLKQLLNIILFSFGVIYSWVYQSLTGNPGAQIGAGLGGFLVASKIGFDAARQAFGASLLAVIVGGVTCGLIGGGLYNGACKILSREDERFRDYRQFVQATNCDQLEADQEQQEMPPEEETPVYYLTGNSMGDLTLAVLSRFMFPVN